MDFSSKLLENAVNEVSRLPGIGKRTALRLVLHLLKQPAENTRYLTEALQLLRTEVKSCEKCHNISDETICHICSNPKRNPAGDVEVEEVDFTDGLLTITLKKELPEKQKRKKHF